MGKKQILAVAMLGMNNSSENDTEHPFDMKPFFDRYNITWLSGVREIEKTNSCPFYETAKAAHEIAKKHSLSNNNVRFIFGRGGWGSSVEKELLDSLKYEYSKYGADRFLFINAKNFGAVDTLRAFGRINGSPEKVIGTVDLLAFSDPYATLFSLNSVSEKITINGKKEKRLIIPPYVKYVYDVYQNNGYPDGIAAGDDKNPLIQNFKITQSYVDSFKKVYDHYSDGYSRKLTVSHVNMEEIVSVIPCCKDTDGKMYTFPDIFKLKFERG